MKLYFTCPNKGSTFSSDEYHLHTGYRIIVNGEGAKELQGIVSLNSTCPFCGEKHQYEIKDVMCPFSGGNK